jgi:hypothetical protein
VIEHYKTRLSFAVVDGLQHSDKVAAALASLIDRLRARAEIAENAEDGCE